MFAAGDSCRRIVWIANVSTPAVESGTLTLHSHEHNLGQRTLNRFALLYDAADSALHTRI